MIDETIYEITDSITPEEFLDLRRVVGFTEFPLEEAAEGLKYSSFICCIRKAGIPIAVGRVIWDHGYVVYIADVIVRPEYQGQGLGREIMERIMEYTRGLLKPGYKIMVNLMAAKGKEGFYRKHGFIDRPADSFGCGMHQWMEG